MISNSLDIPCDTEQKQDIWEKGDKLYLFKDLDGSTTLRNSIDLQAKYVNVFAHIYEPVRNTSSSGQSHGPYSTHACVARYFVDGTPPQKGGAAGYKLHLSSDSYRGLPSPSSASPPTAPHSCRGLPSPTTSA